MRRGHIRPVFARDTRSIRRGDRRDAVLCALSRRVSTHRDYSRKMPRTANEPSPFFNLARRPRDPGEPADHLHHPHLRLGHRLSATSESAAELYISSTATRARRARRGGVHPTLRDAIPAGKKVPSARNFNCRVSDPRSHWPARRGERSHWPARHAGPGISLFLFLSSRNCEEKSSGERGDAGECDSARKNNPRARVGRVRRTPRRCAETDRGARDAAVRRRWTTAATTTDADGPPAGPETKPRNVHRTHGGVAAGATAVVGRCARRAPR